MNKTLMNAGFLKELSEIDVSDVINAKGTIIGLDVGDKTIGVSVSDQRIKIASAVTVILRKKPDVDCAKLCESIIPYNPKVIVFGWPLHMDGTPSRQCKKNLEFVEHLHAYINHFRNDVEFSKWDERFSTKVVDNIMIEADLSRKRRKEVIDKTAAVYILQGALDFLNKNLK